MMKYLVALLLHLLLVTSQASADVVVVVNPANELTELTKQQVIDIYMGRTTQILTNGSKVIPYDQPQTSMIRSIFYENLTGKSVASVNAYWARLLFTGRATPPKQIAENITITDIIENDLNAMGYLDINEVDHRVKIVYKMKSNEQ